LAGSERLSDGEKTFDRIEEAKYINKSLSALGNVIYHLKNQQSKIQKELKRQSLRVGTTTV
jgi:kinesin family protein C2/C3